MLANPKPSMSASSLESVRRRCKPQLLPTAKPFCRSAQASPLHEHEPPVAHRAVGSTTIGACDRNRAYAHRFSSDAALRAACLWRRASINCGSIRAFVCCSRSSVCGRSIHPRAAACSSSPRVPITASPHCAATCRPARSSMSTAAAPISRARQIASSSPASTSSDGSSELGVRTTTQAGRARIHACTGAGVFGC